MRRRIMILCAGLLILFTAACGVNGSGGETAAAEPNAVSAVQEPAEAETAVNTTAETETAVNTTAETETATEKYTTEEAKTEKYTAAEAETEKNTAEEDGMMNLRITAGGESFSARLYDNRAARAFAARLPLTLNMSELHGNEKYYYLDSSLPSSASRPSGIHAGDIMLYGSDCLVLFYESFSTSFSYTSLGYVEDPDGLADALGSGSVQVTFEGE